MCYSSNQTYRGFQILRKEISHRMAFDHFWDNPPVVIEEYITGVSGSQPSSLTVDFKIDAADGTLKMMGCGKMIIRRGCLYSGIQSGLGALEARLKKRW